MANKVKIKSPNPTYNGVSASLQFVKGEAETDDKWLVEWFKNKGYEIDDSAEREAEQKAKEESERIAAEEAERKEAKKQVEEKKKAEKKAKDPDKKDE
ncbi:hypothetical protein [Cytobacillus oceanisediminis]|uniref:hypothetical protein n=1 Tax=Cytobacillus oceanisediminis TaxID=665099 RepID=UPI001C242F2E|nr:hypothetical protein [Cytobacillus oceanisediminis]MBU8773190.1 hypothetical protein [Cytobacillus oceanisediminis]